MSGNLHTSQELLSDSRIETISNILSENVAFCSCLKQIDDRFPPQCRNFLDITVNNFLHFPGSVQNKPDMGFRHALQLEDVFVFQ